MSIKDKLTEIIEILRLKHKECLNNACNEIDDDTYNLRMDTVNFLQGQITMAKEVLKWIK